MREGGLKAKKKHDIYSIMLGRNITYILVLFCIETYAQKTLEFNHLLEYKFKLKHADSVWKTQYILINSEDNSYYAEFARKDSIKSKLTLIDFNGLTSDVFLNYKDIIDADSIIFDCKYIYELSNRYAYQGKNYDFSKLNDTIINNFRLSHYILKSNKPRRERRKKLHTLHYLIDETIFVQKPFFRTPTAYYSWQLDEIFPDNLFIEKYYLDFSGTRKMREHKLISVRKISKLFVIPAECAYSNN